MDHGLLIRTTNYKKYELNLNQSIQTLILALDMIPSPSPNPNPKPNPKPDLWVYVKPNLVAELPNPS